MERPTRLWDWPSQGNKTCETFISGIKSTGRDLMISCATADKPKRMEEFLLDDALRQKILPAITFDDIENVLPVAEALLKAGLQVMEIQMRTPVAENAITLIRKNFPAMYVGAGTLLTAGQLHKAFDAGAVFGLSAALNKNVCDEAKRLQFPFVPGVMTPSEIAVAYELGYSIQKLFPAQQLGGISFLKAMVGPYEQLGIQFIPMGGVNMRNLEEYVQLKNVIAVGGSWIVTKENMVEKNYKAIEDAAREALGCINRKPSL